MSRSSAFSSVSSDSSAFPSSSSLPASPSDCMTTKEVAEYLHIHPQTLYRLRFKKGGIPFLRLSKTKVLYRKSDVDQWFKENITVPGVPSV